jgi:hypothetical protein
VCSQRHCNAEQVNKVRAHHRARWQKVSNEPGVSHNKNFCIDLVVAPSVAISRAGSVSIPVQRPLSSRHVITRGPGTGRTSLPVLQGRPKPGVLRAFAETTSVPTRNQPGANLELPGWFRTCAGLVPRRFRHEPGGPQFKALIKPGVPQLVALLGLWGAR